MTVGKINLGLKANVLIVPFLVEDIGHTYAHISLVSKAHIYQDLYLHNFLSIVFQIVCNKIHPSFLFKWKVQCISMQSPWHGTVSLLTQFNL